MDSEGALVCDVKRLVPQPNKLWTVHPDDEWVDLNHVGGKTWTPVSSIWGVNKKAVYWIEVVEAHDAEEASTLPFFHKDVKWMASFKHDVTKAPAKTTRKRSVKANDEGIVLEALEQHIQEVTAENKKQRTIQPDEPQ
jgi:hypothetical protein